MIDPLAFVILLGIGATVVAAILGRVLFGPMPSKLDCWRCGSRLQQTGRTRGTVEDVMVCTVCHYEQVVINDERVKQRRSAIASAQQRHGDERGGEQQPEQRQQP